MKSRHHTPPRGLGRSAAALLAGALLGLGCRPDASDRVNPAHAEPAAAARAVFEGDRFVCDEGCGSYKTVAPGKTPPPCCEAPMRPAP